MTDIATLGQRAADFAGQAFATNTIKARRSDWNHFTAWCSENDRCPMPAATATVACYIAAMADAGLRVSTIDRRLGTISKAHRVAGLDSPCQDQGVRAVRAGVRRTRGCAPTRKAPLLLEQLRAAVEGETVRNRAILLLGFATACRRSEIAALQVADLAFGPEGLTVTVVRSKTDQDGQGRTIGVPAGPTVAAVRAWLAERPDELGESLFGVCDRTVRDVVVRAVARIGLDPKAFGGHSLRAGLITSAARAGVSELDIARTSGHGGGLGSLVLRQYIRHATVFESNAAGRLGV